MKDIRTMSHKSYNTKNLRFEKCSKSKYTYCIYTSTYIFILDVMTGLAGLNLLFWKNLGRKMKALKVEKWTHSNREFCKKIF